jgi:hypothetical protein
MLVSDRYFLVFTILVGISAAAGITVVLSIVLPSLSQSQKVIHPTTFDQFGIGEIYPTDNGGREWYVNMSDPKSDPYFRNLDKLQFIRQQYGSWRVFSIDSQVRMEAWSPENEKWLNVEITGYAKIVNTTKDSDLLQMYSRGGKHTYADPCIGSAYKARLYGNGIATWVKEVTFPAYTDERGIVRVTSIPVDGRWVGFKAVIYNFNENDQTYVRMESYIDDDVTDANGNLEVKNNWRLASVVEDRGGWATDNDDFDPRCGVARDAILNSPGGGSTGNIVAWRTDHTTWDFKYLSAREIEPPR